MSYAQKVLGVISACMLCGHAPKVITESTTCEVKRKKTYGKHHKSGKATKTTSSVEAGNCCNRRRAKKPLWQRRYDKCPVASSSSSAASDASKRPPCWKVWKWSCKSGSSTPSVTCNSPCASFPRSCTASGTASVAQNSSGSLRASVAGLRRPSSTFGQDAMKKDKALAHAMSDTCPTPTMASEGPTSSIGDDIITGARHAQRSSLSPPARQAVTTPAELPPTSTHSETQGPTSANHAQACSVTQCSTSEQAPSTGSTGWVANDTPELTTSQCDTWFWLAAAAITLLGCVCGQYLRTVFFGSAKPVALLVETSVNTATADVDSLGLGARLQSMLSVWAGCVGWACAGTVVCYVALCHTGAVISFAALAAALQTVAVLMYGLGILGDAALRHFVGHISTAATAVGLQLKGWASFAMVPSLIVIAAVLSCMALAYMVQAIESRVCTPESNARAHSPTSSSGSSGSHLSSTTSSSGSPKGLKQNGRFKRFLAKSAQGASGCADVASQEGLLQADPRQYLIKANHGVYSDRQSSSKGDMQHETADRSANPANLQASRPMRGVKAFVGMANTRLNCYANATLQCLVAIPEFVDLFVSGEAQNGPGQPKRPVSKALAALLRSMQLGRGTVNPRKLLNQLGDKTLRWSNGRQEDAHEFLVALREQIEAETNAVQGKQPFRELSGEGSARDQEEEALANAKRHCDSPIQNMFTGMEQVTMTCKACGRQNHNFFAMVDLQLELPEKGPVTLQELFRMYTQPEEVDRRTCRSCGNTGCASKQASVCGWPHILVVHLKRFGMEEANINQAFDTAYKNEVPVEVAETVVPFELTSLNTAAPTYDLVGVTQHLSNTLLGGHYTALCRSSADGCVYSCNDTKIAAAQFPSRPSSSPYLLMYRQKG